MRAREKTERKYKKPKEEYSPEMDIAWEKMSARELQCIYWAIRGYQNDEVGDKLCIEGVTVERHMGQVYQKTNISAVEGSAVRKLLWFANRDNMIKYLDADGILSQEYLASRHMDHNVAKEYQREIRELTEMVQALTIENDELREKVEATRRMAGTFGPLHLSANELEIARMVKSGDKNSSIAVKLGCPTAHVSHVCQTLRSKFGIMEKNRYGRTQLVIKLQSVELDEFEEDQDDLGPMLSSELIEVAERIGT